MKRMIYDLHVRLDSDTYEFVKKNLEAKNEQLKKKIKLSEYVRMLIANDKMEQAGLDKAALIQCVRVLAGIGNNINQIAHHVNAGTYLMGDSDKLEEGLSSLTEIRQQIEALTKKLF